MKLTNIQQATVWCVRGHLQAYVEEVLGQLGNLLLVRGPDNGVQHQLSPDDQLFVYETAGVLVVQSQLDVEVSLTR